MAWGNGQGEFFSATEFPTSLVSRVNTRKLLSKINKTKSTNELSTYYVTAAFIFDVSHFVFIIALSRYGNSHIHN